MPVIQHDITQWIAFNAVILFLLILDLVVFNRKAHEITIKEALGWSAFWISLALVFNVWVAFEYGKEIGLQWFTGYLIEKSLSVDNLFVFLLLFTYFKVPAKYQHKVLFWGIIGALVMRGILILLGAALIARFHWILYLFGLFLVFTGVKMFFSSGEDDVHPEKNIVVRVFKKFFPVKAEYHWDLFFIRVDGKRYATLLFIVLIVVETTDLVFAVDSIPAIFAITRDPFIVYTSNVFAILGLRSLYFALAGMMDMFHYLRQGLAIVLTFIGVKMLFMDIFPIPIWLALSIVGTVLAVSIAASIVRAPRLGHQPPADPPDPE
ncbi:MAG: TerC family protein [Bacteroidetes bacterium]|jgi:tellurite resistance protein TerC|nr:TerC family protein [Bacteroidota bacterium]